MKRTHQMICKENKARMDSILAGESTQIQENNQTKVKGVGTVLSSIFSTIGIATSEGCSCRRHAVEMDRRGTTWCLENIETILGWLQTEATVRNLVFFRAGIKIALYSLLKAYSVFEKVRPDSGEDSRVFSRRDDEWAVVVTAAPRAGEYTLAKCLQSIIAAGWSDPIVFAEPGIDVPDGITTFHNPTRRGCFHNWLYSAKWALENTTAEMILCVQDDSLFHPDSRQFTEDHCLWPSEDTGIVSLYTASHYQGDKGVMKPVGVNEVYTSVWWGTCAVVWRRSALQAVIDHEITKNWLGISPRKQADESHNPKLRARRVAEYFEGRKTQPHLINNSDYVAGHVLNLLGCRKFFVDPSPVSHISKVSTINHGGNSGKRNCARCADHRKPLASQVGTAINRIEKKEDFMASGRGPRPAGQPLIITPGVSVGDTPKHTFLIRTSFRDPVVSAYRWNVTQHTLLQSLASQNNKNFEIQLICGEDDPLREVKLAAFSEVATTTIAPKDWYNQPHDGVWRRTTRVDDDDMLSIRFVELLAEQPFDGTECLFNFPIGCLWSEGVSHRWNYPVNQFITIQTNTRLTPYHFAHQYYQQIMPAVIVTQDIHWMWIRHHGVLSGATPGAIPKRFTHGVIQTNASLFPYDFSAIKTALVHNNSAVVKVLELRAKYGRVDKDVLNICANEKTDELSALAATYGTDKGVSGTSDKNHQYTLIYDRLFSGIRDKVEHVLEFGVFRGASLLMWADYFPKAQIHGLDKKRRSVPHPRIVTHRFNSITPLDTHFKFDLLVDDASHISSHQRVMFELHNKHVRPGGFYVIEDLHACRLGGAYLNESPSMLETCREWVSNPPFGWTCQLYGDQLCVLQKDE
jgi:hypothetical protein